MALRLIMNVPNLTHSAPLFKECQIMPIHQRAQYRTATMVFKIIHGLTPSYMSELVKCMNNVSTRTTRYSQANKLYVPNRKLCVSRRALRYNGATLYNSLDRKIQDCTTLNAFKYQAYKSFMARI